MTVSHFEYITDTFHLNALFCCYPDGCEAYKSGSRTIAPNENYPPTLILALTPKQTLTLTGGNCPDNYKSVDSN